MNILLLCCSINDDFEEHWIFLFDNDDGDVEFELDIVVDLDEIINGWLIFTIFEW